MTAATQVLNDSIHGRANPPGASSARRFARRLAFSFRSEPGSQFITHRLLSEAGKTPS